MNEPEKKKHPIPRGQVATVFLTDGERGAKFLLVDNEDRIDYLETINGWRISKAKTGKRYYVPQSSVRYIEFEPKDETPVEEKGEPENAEPVES